METLKHTTQVKAIKEHRCNFCGEKIFKGDSYLTSTHKMDGVVYDWKTHQHCNEVADKLKLYDICEDGVSQDQFIESVSEFHDDLLISMFPQDEVKKYSYLS